MKKGVFKIEVVSDVVCPWCFIGKRRLEKGLGLIGNPPGVKVFWKPFELNPGLPKEGVSREVYMKAKFGTSGIPPQMKFHLQTAAESVGLRFDFDRMSRMPNTFDAHRLIRFAEQEGAQAAVVEGLFRAVFMDGKFIGDHKILLDIAAEAGLDAIKTGQFLASNRGASEVRQEEAEAINRGVDGVPNFLINGQFEIGGAQPPEVMAKAIDQALSQ